MSVRSYKAREGHIPPTDPKWYPLTRGLNRWLNKVAGRDDLAIRVLRGNLGAVARFVPNVAEIDFSESLVARIDPHIAGTDEFIAKHPDIAGGGIHEAGHARSSVFFDIPGINREFGERHTGIFLMLEEGREETQLWPFLRSIEKDALKYMVLRIVLKEVLPEDGSKPDFSDLRILVRLMGLMSGRVHTGIIDLSQERTAILWNHVRDVLGDDVFDQFYGLGVRFATTSNDTYFSNGRSLAAMHEVVREWIAAEDDLLPPPDGPGPGPGPKGKKPKGEDQDDEESDDTTSGGGGDDEESDDANDSDGTSDDDADDAEGDDGGTAEGDSEGDDGGTAETPVGDDDEGDIGDGSNEIDSEQESGPGLGNYASSHISEVLEDIFDDLAEAIEEEQHISGSRLKRQMIQIRKAVAADHSRRRQFNKEAAKKWRV